MKTSKQLKEERALISAKIDELSKVENPTDAQVSELRDALKNEENLTNSIETALEFEKREAAKAAEVRANAGVAGGKNNSGEEKELRKFSLSKLIAGVEGSPESRSIDTGFECEVLGITKDTRSFKLSEQLLNAIMPEKRTMTAAGATAGGNFIPTEKIGFFDALFAATVLDSLGVQRLTGLSANTDLTGFTASVVSAFANGETGTQTPTDPTTAARELRPKLLYAATNISRRLLIQTNPSIDQFVMQNIMRSMAVKLEQAVINGAGSTEPTGILSSGIASVAIGANGGAPTYPKILELIQTVLTNDGANVNRMFLANPKVVAKLKQTELDSGSGAFIMGYNGLFGSQMGVIDGYNVAVTSNVPSNLSKGNTTGVCSALIFGDFANVVVGQFGQIEVIVDPYTSARTGTIEYTVNQFVDSTVLQPLALGAIADLTTT